VHASAWQLLGVSVLATQAFVWSRGPEPKVNPQAEARTKAGDPGGGREEVTVQGAGPHVEAVIGLVTGVCHLSRRVAVSLMSDVLGIDISLGAESAVEERVSEATKQPVDEGLGKAPSCCGASAASGRSVRAATSTPSGC
jgi:hypothetical protein